jgi:hypothetical protein
VDVVVAVVMVMSEIVFGASTIVMAKAEIVVGAFTIVMVKTEIVVGVLPFERDWGDYRRFASSSWPEGLPNYLTRLPSVMEDAELASPLLALLPFVLLAAVVVVNAVALIATDVDGPKS